MTPDERFVDAEVVTGVDLGAPLTMSTRTNTPHLRVARPCNRLEELTAMYRDGLGFEVLGGFVDHDGSDGVMHGEVSPRGPRTEAPPNAGSGARGDRRGAARASLDMPATATASEWGRRGGPMCGQSSWAPRTERRRGGSSRGLLLRDSLAGRTRFHAPASIRARHPAAWCSSVYDVTYRRQ